VSLPYPDPDTGPIQFTKDDPDLERVQAQIAAELRHLTAEINRLEAQRAAVVDQGRGAHMSFRRLGVAVGMSEDVARSRYGRGRTPFRATA